VSPERLESLGIAVVLLGAASAIAGTWALAGWPWALITLAVLAIVAGVVLVRTAALTPASVPEPEPEKAGESA